MDPRIRIHTKMSWIRNTGSHTHMHDTQAGSDCSVVYSPCRLREVRQSSLLCLHNLMLCAPFRTPCWNRSYTFGAGCTLLSYKAPYWATLHPTMLRCTPPWVYNASSELRRTLLSYAKPYLATLHPTDLRYTLLSFAAPFLPGYAASDWASLHVLSYAYSTP